MKKKLGVKKVRLDGFTLLEMLVVLMIISVLLLLFVPNLAKHKGEVDQKGQQALSKLVETQRELYILEKDAVPTLEQLVEADYLTKEQYDQYQKGQR